MNSTGFLKGTLILTIAGFVVKAIGFFNWIILSRVMGGEGIGLYQLAFPLYLMALSVSSAGIPVAISVITAEKVACNDFRGANRVFRISLTALTVTGLAFSLLLFFGANWLIDYRFIRDPRAYYAVIALAPAVFFVTMLSSFRGYLQGWQVMTPTALSQIVEQLLRVVTMVAFATLLLPRGLEYAAGGASLGAAPGAIGGLAVLLYYYRRLQTDIKIRYSIKQVQLQPESCISIIRRLLKLALPVSLASIMLPLVANLDLLIVPARLEAANHTIAQATEMFGYLTGMAVPLVNLATIITASLATSLVPAISEACSLNDRSGIRQRTAAAMRLSNLVSIPGSVILWLLAGPIALIVYNAPAAAGTIQFISGAVCLLGIHQVTTGVLQGLGRTYIPVINMGIAAVAKVILNWSLTASPALGIKGAALATVADIGVAAALNLYFINRYTGYILNVRELANICLAAGIMGTLVYYLDEFLASAAILKTLVTLGAGAIIYVVVLLLLGCLTDRDICRLPLLGNKLVKILHKLGLLK